MGFLPCSRLVSYVRSACTNKRSVARILAPPTVIRRMILVMMNAHTARIARPEFVEKQTMRLVPPVPTVRQLLVTAESVSRQMRLSCMDPATPPWIGSPELSANLPFSVRRGSVIWPPGCVQTQGCVAPCRILLRLQYKQSTSVLTHRKAGRTHQGLTIVRHM